MSERIIPCGLVIGDPVDPTDYDERIECGAVNCGPKTGLDSLDDLGNGSPQYVISFHPATCERYRSDESDVDHNFPCPIKEGEVHTEIQYMHRAGYSIKDLEEAIDLYHPVFQEKARRFLTALQASEQPNE